MHHCVSSCCCDCGLVLLLTLFVTDIGHGGPSWFLSVRLVAHINARHVLFPLLSRVFLVVIALVTVI